MSIFDNKINIISEEYLFSHGYIKCKEQEVYFKDLNTIHIHVMGVWCQYNIGIIYSPTGITIISSPYAFSYRLNDEQNIVTIYTTNFDSIDEFTLESIEFMFSKDKYELSEWIQVCNYKFL